MGAKVRVAIVEANKFSCPFGDCGFVVVCEWLAPKSSEGAGGKGRGDAMEYVGGEFVEGEVAEGLEVLLSYIGNGGGGTIADEVFEGLGWLSAVDAPTINNHAGIDFVLLIPERASSKGSSVLFVSRDW